MTATDREVLFAIIYGDSPFIVNRPATAVLASLRKMKAKGLVELADRGWRVVRAQPHKRRRGHA